MLQLHRQEYLLLAHTTACIRYLLYILSGNKRSEGSKACLPALSGSLVEKVYFHLHLTLPAYR